MLKNREGDKATSLKYSEFPQHFTYDRRERKWKTRSQNFSIGRLTHSSPSQGELYFLRVMLTKVMGRYLVSAKQWWRQAETELPRPTSILSDGFKDAQNRKSQEGTNDLLNMLHIQAWSKEEVLCRSPAQIRPRDLHDHKALLPVLRPHLQGVSRSLEELTSLFTDPESPVQIVVLTGGPGTGSLSSSSLICVRVFILILPALY